ncbi:hypothetical protein Pan44_50150 [Caulifigura coniformis]|uniref:Periplasmic repressor CpxP n=1 Tax=Caulifigura coniformis TaxID=2527983 RepID=A0A517SLF2_9PLAN|nr:hypothetical protein [Caulifigura coniformis]QDT56952.1 hypothetical protein Pan44_50150 [Caulifigura coniformis]
MQRWTKTILAAGVAVAMGAMFAPAMAQRPEGQGRGGFRGGFGGGMFGGGGAQITVFSAVQSEPVQKELAITEDQKSKLTALGDEVRTAMRELRPMGGRGEGERPSREEMEKMMAEYRTKADAIVTEKKSSLAAIISADQMTRLEQIVLQARGADALTDGAVQAKLMVTDEQKAKMASVASDFASKEREAMSGLFQRREGGEGRGNFDPEAMRAAGEKRAALQKEKEAALVAVLSDAQAEQYDLLKGKAFAEIDAVRRAGFGGGRGPGGPGGGRGGDRPQRPATEN